MSILSVVLTSVGLFGIRHSNASLQAVYADRLIPVNQLGLIKANLYQNRLRVFKTMILPNERELSIQIMEENLDEAKKIWDEYQSTTFTTEEKVLADKFIADRALYIQEFIAPAVKFLKASNFDELEKLIGEKANPSFVAVEKGIDDLIDLQIKVAKQEYESAQSVYKIILISSIIALVLGLGGSVLFALTIISYLVKSVGEAKKVATAISHGDFNSQIVVDGNDEISTLLHSMQTMQKILISFVDAQHLMAKKHAEGWIAEKIDTSKFQGTYSDMAGSINQLVQSHIDVKMHVIDIVTEYAKGDFTRSVDNLPGDKAKITKAIHNVKTALLSINNEIEMIASAGARGDFSKRANANNFDFMFKSMLGHLNTFVETCDTGFNDVLRVANALADGDLTQTITKEYPGVFGQVKIGVNNTVQNLTGLIAEIKETTSTIAAASTEIAAGNNDLAHRTEQQAAALEETASSMHELTSTVEHNSENAKQANNLAVGATEIANKGVTVVQDVVSTMENINESSLRIVDIISVIDDIAFQTNILALNAAVEAARAGDQGKGFAVVATEVRNLAQRAANAAGEIKRLIGDSVERVSGGSKQVAEAGQTMQDIVQAIEGVNKIIAEIAAASAEQSAGISQVGQAIGSMDDVTQQNAALVEQVAATAESLETQTQHLAKELEHFKTSTGGQRSSMPAPKSTKTASAPAKSAPAAKAKSEAISTFTTGNDDWEEF
jgi:methyl-accepting chemotaxis protein